MHRAIMGVTDSKTLVDHWKGNGLNNTRENIRVCTHSQNRMNTKSVKESSSRFKGVYWYCASKKWMSSIKIDGKCKYLGYFDNEEDAARTYNQFAKEYHGEFARYNEVSPMFPSNPKI